MSQAAPFQIALALVSGLVAQVIGAWSGIPGIVLLLAAGVALGADGVGVLTPATLGTGLRDIVNVAVTVILFEGGLGLDLSRLQRDRRVLALLLSAGAACSLAGGMLGAHALLGMPWSTALLYGCLIIVTGPTVVTPLVTRLGIERRLRDLLISEGVLIDPIGAILALVAAEWVVGEHAAVASGWIVLERLGVGAAVGVAAGAALALVLRGRAVAPSLRSPLALGATLAVATSASRVSAEAGLVAAVLVGVMLANTRIVGIARIREFTDGLTVVLLSLVFVLLAANLRLAQVGALGWSGIAVIAILAWVARPLGVAIATAGSDLDVRRRALLAWLCPRGIVAASVAGLFRLELDAAGIAGGAQLEALVFVTVALTVTVQGLTARPVARALRLHFPTAHGTIIIGADRLGQLLATLLTPARQVVLMDRNPWFCRAAEARGLAVYEGDALSLEALEQAGARHADAVIALTRNPELNALVAQRVREAFRVDRILALTHAAGEAEEHGEPFPGDFPGTDAVNALLREGRVETVDYRVDPSVAGHAVGTLPFAAGEFALLLHRGDGVAVATGEHVLETGDVFTCARTRPGSSPLDTALGGGIAPQRRPTLAAEGRPA